MPIERVTHSLLLVLSAMLADPSGEHYGYGIARTTGLAGGTVQPIMARLEAEQWLSSRREDIDPRAEGRRPRRLYRLTTLGLRAAEKILDEHRDRLVAPVLPSWIGSSK